MINDDGFIYVGKQGDISNENWAKVKELFIASKDLAVNLLLCQGYRYSMGYWHETEYKGESSGGIVE